MGRNNTSVENDERFEFIRNDPKFKKLRKRQKKTVIDERFQGMFTEEKFQNKIGLDKRGRTALLNKKLSDYKDYYELDKESSSDENDINASDEESNASSNDAESINLKSNELPKLTPEEQKELLDKVHYTDKIRARLRDKNVDYARGEGRLFSESSSDESESEDDSENEIYHDWNEQDKDVESTSSATSRLAICNMDWDRIRAMDLLMLLNSFLPSKGVIYSVTIYPSEYGLKRLAEEEEKGPAELAEIKNDESEDDSDNELEEGSKTQIERMRQYQLKRLKYYYAVAIFDSSETADVVYTQCNGIEYESSGIKVDLRFVPDDMTFEQDPKDSCSGVDSVAKYEPLFFTNSALQQAKVEITWDETDPRRIKTAQRITEAAKNGDVNDSDLENLVALSSSDEEDEHDEDNEDNRQENEHGAECKRKENMNENDLISLYRSLLNEGDNKNKESVVDDSSDGGDVIVSWNSDESDVAKDESEDEEEEKRENTKLTPFEKYAQKKKNKLIEKRMKKKLANQEIEESTDKEKSKKSKKQKKEKSSDGNKSQEELDLLLMEENLDDNKKSHFNLNELEKKEKSKKKRKNRKKAAAQPNETKDDDFKIDVKDSRFERLYTSPSFNIDPTNSKFHKTEGMEQILLEKQKRRKERDAGEMNDTEHKSKKIKTNANDELSSLVKSVKNKTKSTLFKSKNKVKS